MTELCVHIEDKLTLDASKGYVLVKVDGELRPDGSKPLSPVEARTAADILWRLADLVDENRKAAAKEE